MKIIGYQPLLYGKEYLATSLNSVKDHVDKFVILYTPTGSQGHKTDLVNPDSEEEMRQIASDVLGNKLIWSSKEYSHEAEHRADALNYVGDANILLTLDADEVFEPADIEAALKTTFDSPLRYQGINGFINFWKSFDYILIDQFRPIRFINLKNEGGQGEVMQRIYHFSCAQRAEIVKFKWNTSGHRAELFEDWMDKYFNWYPGCAIEWLHPASHQIWQKPELFDKTTLPDILKNHPNYTKALI